MNSMFGERWIRSFGERTDPDGTWSRALAGLTPRQIADGLNAVLRLGEKWPPSAPEFRAMCLKKTHDRGEGAYGGMHRLLKPLGLPESEERREQRKAFGREQSKKLLELMRGAGSRD